MKQGYVHAPTSIKGPALPTIGLAPTFPTASYQVPTGTVIPHSRMTPFGMMVQTDTQANVTAETITEIAATDAEDFLVQLTSKTGLEADELA